MQILTFLSFGLAAVAVVSAQNLTIEIISAKDCYTKTKNGDTISVNYNGTLTDGTLFDSSMCGVIHPWKYFTEARE